jgi:lipopolysaccharide export LptBFGC system permease protein LptF
MRLTACVSAFALAALGFGIGRVRRRRAGTHAIAWWAMMILVTAVLQMRGFAPPSHNIHPALGYWAMYAALLITGVLLTRRHEAD